MTHAKYKNNFFNVSFILHCFYFFNTHYITEVEEIIPDESEHYVLFVYEKWGVIKKVGKNLGAAKSHNFQ